MAATTKAKQAASVTGVNLERLTQAQAAWLVGRPANWLRDNAHIEGRAADGTYNGKDLVRALSGDFRAADLPDESLEAVMQLTEEFVCSVAPEVLAVLRLLEQIERDAGAAGLAAVTVELVKQLRDANQEWGASMRPERPTPEAIRAKAEAEIRELTLWDARQNRRVVLVCQKCRRHRWARTWRKAAIPAGYAPSLTFCPKCEG